MIHPLRCLLVVLFALTCCSIPYAFGQTQQLADLSVTKTGPAQASADSDVTYTVDVFNNGPDDSVQATLADQIPAGTTFVSVSPAAGWSCNTNGNPLVCTKSSVPNGADDVFTFVFHINPNTAPGTVITNEVNVSQPPDPDFGSHDPNEENNSAFVDTTIPGGSEADLGITKTGDAQALADSDVHYTITVQNFGPDQGTNAEWADRLPGDMTFVSLNQTSGPTWTCSTPTSGAGGTVVCDNATVPTGKSTFILTGHVPRGEQTGTVYDNIASISSSSDPNPENDSATLSTTVVAAAPTLTTQASPSVQAGNAISDMATLSGGINPTGTITFLVYGPDDSTCSASPAFSSAANVSGNGQYDSGPFFPSAPGTYYFVASYSGDNNNKAIASVCNDANESVLVTAPPPSPTPTATPTATPSQALNLSTRLRAETGDKVMIGGFIIAGQEPKAVVLRGLGPSLSKFGLTDLLLDPVLQLRGSSGNLIFENDNWKDTQRNLIEGTPYQPTNDRESVIVTTLTPTSYTVILTGKNGTTGIGAVEVYDNNQGVDSELANMSTRGFVQTQDKVMIGGFSLGVGNGQSRIAIRGLGPSLAQAGISNVLADPTLELHDANGTLLIANDDWQSDPVSAAQLTANGLALPNPKESGIFTSLPGGQFTAILAGKNGGIGVGLVEIYNLK
jgi:uncharacterized repeat protein (TIGR01451 family)